MENHLQELYSLVKNTILFASISAIGWSIVSPQLLTDWVNLFNKADNIDQLSIYSPFNWIEVKWSFSIMMGIITAFPLFSVMLYRFSKPGLYPNELFPVKIILIVNSLLLPFSIFLIWAWGVPYMVKYANGLSQIENISANNTNINIKYNGTLTGQVAVANADFQLSAVGASTPISFYTNGSSKVIIDSSGRMGINRTPALGSSKLEVGGADNYPLINVEASGATGGMGIGSGILRLYYGTTSRLNITDSTGNVSATNFTTGGYFGSSGPGGGTGIKLQGLAAGSGSSAVDTGISVNRGNAGGTMLVIASRNTGAGTATQGYVWLLKFQYDGNQLPTEYNIAGTGSFWSLSLSGSNTLQINGNVANWQFGGMWVD